DIPDTLSLYAIYDLNYHSILLDFSFLFFFNDTATTEIYTLSLHDALPIWGDADVQGLPRLPGVDLRLAERDDRARDPGPLPPEGDRKSTRLNSSHVKISYAVFCLKKKKKNKNQEINLKHHKHHEQLTAVPR